ncbi:ABC transporter substrate-binding protein [Salinivibrio sp. ES.052]|uniref:substrate-binding periplasmic protein n=1 Tax=Salinivibrio sp. ES.052 TaxID=1882823 RepID=UPI00092B251C|nr:transporter substrate-binding domain-containing protein [Salinivibrio sp. ES.052]SIO36512.1 amino acid ABC transporter substrate-binding protein, PAAT family [Salinivibrio sp. ES.052]
MLKASQSVRLFIARAIHYCDSTPYSDSLGQYCSSPTPQGKFPPLYRLLARLKAMHHFTESHQSLLSLCRRPVLRVLLVVLLLGMTGVVHAATSTIRLVTLEYPPYIQRSDGDLDGVAVRVVSQTFAKLGYDVEIEVLPWARALYQVRSGLADGIFTIFKNPEREAFLDYSKQILFHQGIRLIHRADVNVSNQVIDSLDFQGYSVCVVNLVSYGSQMDAALTQNHFDQTFRLTRAPQCLRMLESGRARLWLSNYFGARILIKQMNLADIVEIHPHPIQETPSYIAFSKRRELSALRDQFDQAFAEMKANGEYQTIIDDFFDD